MLTPIIDITPTEFQPGSRLTLVFGSAGNQTETFTITCIGRIVYAVSVEHGFNYTRKQLIEKYGRVSAQYLPPVRL